MNNNIFILKIIFYLYFNNLFLFFINLISMKTYSPLVEQTQRTDFLDEALLDHSKELFKIPYFGYGIAAFINIIYLYHWCKRATLFSLFINIFLAYLIFKIVQAKFFKR